VKTKLASTFSLLVVLLLCGAGGSAQDLHPKLKNGEKTVRTVLVLPPKVEIVRQGVKGVEGMIKESEEVEEVILKMISNVLNEKNINLAASPFTPQSLEANNELKYALADIQTRYDALLPKMQKKSNDVTKGRFSLGDEVMKLSPEGAADALMFIRARGVQPTTGKQIFGVLTLTPSFPIVALSIGLVDSHTGDVLLYAKPIAIGDAVKRGEKVLNKPIAKSLKKLPIAPQNPKKGGSG